jgi:two-component system response regulator QseB
VRLLLVEDDLMVGQSIRDGLKKHGFVVDYWVTSGVAAESALSTHSHDLLLLDIGLPRKSGTEVLRSLRATTNNIPVLIVTARDQVADRIRVLDSGADDYLVKPFDLGELAARVRALARRRAGNAAPQLTSVRVDWKCCRILRTRGDRTRHEQTLFCCPRLSLVTRYGLRGRSELRGASS